VVTGCPAKLKSLVTTGSGQLSCQPDSHHALASPRRPIPGAHRRIASHVLVHDASATRARHAPEEVIIVA
jgi:hypothetical protein